jgi:hypothetical protein
MLQADAVAVAARPITADPFRRAEAVVPLLDAGNPRLDAEARRILVQCGTGALPVLRQLIGDELRPDRFSFLATLVEAGDRASVPYLERLLREEKVYWNNLGMNLDDASKIDRARVQFLVDLLTHLQAFGYRDEQEVVSAVRDQFRDHPLLCTEDRVVEAANALLSR